MAYTRLPLQQDPVLSLEARHYQCRGCLLRFTRSKRKDELNEWVNHKSHCEGVKRLIQEWEDKWYALAEGVEYA